MRRHFEAPRRFGATKSPATHSAKHPRRLKRRTFFPVSSQMLRFAQHDTLCYGSRSSLNALWMTLTASSPEGSSITQEILISLVEIIWMLMPASASAVNMV